MDIKEFFEHSEGKWFSQRTRYNLASAQSENSKSEITIEMLSQDDPEVVKLCQQSDVNAASTWGGAKISWDNSVDDRQEKQTGYAVVVPIPNADKPEEGKLLQTRSDDGKSPTIGRYIVGNDESLTLIAEDETTYLEERLWFAHPNLRLRTVLNGSDQFSMAAFYSEIRRIPPKSSQC